MVTTSCLSMVQVTDLAHENSVIPDFSALENILTMGEIPFSSHSVSSCHIFSPLYFIYYVIPLLFLLTFFQLSTIKYFPERTAQVLLLLFFVTIARMSMWLYGSQAPFKQTANYSRAATKVNYKYVNWERIKYSLNIRHLLWKLSVIRYIKDFPSICSCGISL